MKNNIIHFSIIISCLTIALIIAALFTFTQKPNEPDQLGVSTTLKTIPSTEFNKYLFEKNIQQAISAPKKINEKLSGAVIPHHDTAGTMIADLFINASQQGIEHIIIVGSNHQDLGPSNILTTQLSWETAFGIVENNSELTNKIIEEKVAVDNKSFEKEQSIYVLMPFIKSFLPNAKVSSIILKKSTTQDEEQNIANLLAPLLNDKTLLVASVDFSHYLPRPVAEQKDAETLDLIMKKDLRNLYKLNSDHLDSPSSISVLLQAMQKIGKDTIKVSEHSNSDKIQNINSGNTTGYYHLIFY